MTASALSLPGISTNINPTDPGSVGAYGKNFGQALQLPGFDYMNNPEMSQIQSLLNPGAGGLSSQLMAMLGIGAGQIGQQTAGNVANSISRSEGMGIAGSTPAQAGIASAEAGGSNALQQLLASLFGQQEGANSQLANTLFGAEQGNAQDYGSRISALLSYLQGGQENAVNYGMYQSGLNNATDTSKQSNQMELLSSLIGGASQLGSQAILGSYLA